MELNNNQVELCLQHALEQFLASWEGTTQEAWQRLQDLCETNPDTENFDEAAAVEVCDTYSYLRVDDLVEKIKSAYSSNQQLIRDVYVARTLPESPSVVTIEVKGGMVTDVSNLPDGWDYEVNDLD